MNFCRMSRRWKRLSLLLILTFCCMPILAQSNDTIFTNKHRHELEIGFGTAPFVFVLANAFSHRDYEDYFVDTSYPINLHSQYMYNVSKYFGVGANVSYSTFSEEYYREEKGQREEKVGWYYNHLFTFGLTIRTYWLYKKYWAMYSKYGITLSVGSKGDSARFWPLNVSLVGVEAGGKRWRGYFEPLNLISTWPSVQIGVKYLF